MISQVNGTTVVETQESLLDSLLNDQQRLSAVDRFAQESSHQRAAAGAKYYRDLIPAATPGAGEQYAFEVDLDSCSGCKACVAACHSLNGLEPDELWRNVGQLVGGTNELPVIQHVTAACHHCVEPACLTGCPVEAYVKDEVTGIVRHLDDQCIGCQYCVLKCPYDVPVYSRSKGIVRKCDMCHDRLSVGEAPACVQSCPNQAIRISIVDQATVIADSEAASFLPGAPGRTMTIPTTNYKSSRPSTANLLPADYFSVQRAHGHLPLVVMLVLTQLSVGAFVVEQFVYSYSATTSDGLAQSIKPLHLVAALAFGLLGLTASLFHLGRPQYAYRAVLGLRTSWLSREIVAFGLFAAAAVAYVAGASLPLFRIGFLDGALLETCLSVLGFTAAATGVSAVFCSVMIYVDTHRPCWTLAMTSAKFFLSCAVLGLPAALVASLFAAVVVDAVSTSEVLDQFGGSILRCMIIATAAKLSVEASLFRHLAARHHTPLKRSSMLQVGELRRITMARFIIGAIGGLLLPKLLLTVASPQSVTTGFALTVAALSFLMLLAGEVLERYLFFVASVSPKMPGIPAA